MKRAAQESPPNPPTVISHTVGSADDLVRLKELALRVFGTAVASGSHAKRLIKTGQLLVDGVAVERAHRVRAGSVVSLAVACVRAPKMAHRDEASRDRHIGAMQRGGLRVLREDSRFDK